MPRADRSRLETVLRLFGPVGLVVVGACDRSTAPTESPNGNDSFVSGAVYIDVDKNDRAGPGEGLTGVAVTFAGPDGVRSATTDASGRYTIALEPGTYSVTLSDPPDTVYFAESQGIGVPEQSSKTLDLQAKRVRREGNITLAGETHFIDSTVASQFRVLSDSLTVLAPAGQMAEPLVSGDILITPPTAANLGGLMRRVDAVLPDVGGMHRFSTVPVAIEDAIVEGAFAFEGGVGDPVAPTFLPSLAPTAASNLVRTPDGWYVELQDIPVYDEDGDLGTTFDQIRIRGSLTINPQFFAANTIRDGVSLRSRWGVAVTGTLVAEIVWAPVERAVARREFSLGEINWGRLPLKLKFPLPIVPVTELFWGIEGQAQGGLTAGVETTLQISGGIEFTNGVATPWGEIDQQTDAQEPRFTVAAGIETFFRIPTTFLVGGVAGPYLSIQAGLRAQADLLADPWWEILLAVETETGFRLGGFADKLKIPPVSVVASRARWTVAQAQGAFSNEPPTATITSPASGSSYREGETVVFQGQGADLEDGAVPTSRLSWNSSLDGSLGGGAQLATSSLSVGLHTVTLTVTDSQGASGAAQVQVSIAQKPANQAPTAEIFSPLNGSSYTEGQSVTFSGRGIDPEDGAVAASRLSWNSSLDGSLGNGGQLTTSSLSVGLHVVTLTVTDSQGANGSVQVQLSIVRQPVNQAPTAEIFSPANGSVYAEGQSVTFSGRGIDPEEGTLSPSRLSWSSNRAGSLGTGTILAISNLSVGVHVVTLTVTDSQGAVGSVQVQLSISEKPANRPPTATITSPVSGSSYREGEVVVFQGHGVDPEDGTVETSRLSWHSSLDGSLGNGAQLTTSSLSAGLHVVTLTATDSQGASGSTQIQLSVTRPPAPPSVVLTTSSDVVVGGEQVILTWTSANATLCVASWAGGNRVDTRGSRSVSPRETTAYAIVCGGDGDATASSSVTVTVRPPELLSVEPNPVTGSNSRQVVRLYGRNFFDKPTVILTWSGQSGYVVPTAQVTFVNRTQIDISITTGTDADTWTARVVNPDGQRSAAAVFNVRRP